jgi:formate dehydrogenase subunit gamma
MSVDNNNQNEAAIARIAKELKDKPGALLPILHEVQDHLGYVPPEAVPIIALELNLTRAEVHGVVTFYHEFRSTPPGRHIVRICQAESCQAAGSAALTTSAKARLGVDFHETTRDKAFTLEPVYCLGLCACSPSMMIDGEVFGRVTPDRFVEIVEETRKQ